MIDEVLLEALKDCHAMGDSLSECVGFLTATIAADETLTPEGIAGARNALLAWHRAGEQFRSLIADAEECL